MNTRKMTIALALAALAAPMYASAQGARTSMGALMNEKKPRMLQLQLLRTSPLCGSVTDCNEAAGPYRASPQDDPCMTDMVSCHMAAISDANGHSRSWNIGGAKLSANVGRVTFTIGRHRKNIALARVPFVEGKYRFDGTASLAFGVLRQRYGPEKDGMAYLIFQKELW